MAEEGASPREIVLEAARRNNTDLLEEVLNDIRKAAGKDSKKATRQIADLLNTAQDGLGNPVLHVAASYGSYEVLDEMLDQEGVEIDGLDRMEKDTPLHKAVRYVNQQSKDEWEGAHPLVEMLIDAGCDPRIRNKAKLRPIDLVDPRNTTLRMMLQKADYAFAAGDDVVVEDDDEGGTGSGSE